MSVEANHLTPEPRSRWSRKRKGLAAVIGFVLFAVAGFALAALLLRAPFQGGGTTNARPQLRIETAVATPDPDGLASCTATALGPDGANISVNGIAGGFCDVAFTVRKQGSANVATLIQDVKYATPEITVGYLNGGCGTTVPADNSTVGVSVRFSIPNDAADVTYTVDPDAGLYAVSSSGFNPATCPTAA